MNQNYWDGFAILTVFLKRNGKKAKSSGLNVLNSHGAAIGNTEPRPDLVNNLNGFIANHDRLFMRIDSVEDLNRVKQSGKIGIIIGLQKRSTIQGCRGCGLILWSWATCFTTNV